MQLAVCKITLELLKQHAKRPLFSNPAYTTKVSELYPLHTHTHMYILLMLIIPILFHMHRIWDHRRCAHCLYLRLKWGQAPHAYSRHPPGPASYRLLEPGWLCQEVWETVMESETWGGEKKTKAEIWGEMGVSSATHMYTYSYVVWQRLCIKCILHNS